MTSKKNNCPTDDTVFRKLCVLRYGDQVLHDLEAVVDYRRLQSIDLLNWLNRDGLAFDLKLRDYAISASNSEFFATHRFWWLLVYHIFFVMVVSVARVAGFFDVSKICHHRLLAVVVPVFEMAFPWSRTPWNMSLCMHYRPLFGPFNAFWRWYQSQTLPPSVPLPFQSNETTKVQIAMIRSPSLPFRWPILLSCLLFRLRLSQFLSVWIMADREERIRHYSVSHQASNPGGSIKIKPVKEGELIILLSTKLNVQFNWNSMKLRNEAAIALIVNGQRVQRCGES